MHKRILAFAMAMFMAIMSFPADILAEELAAAPAEAAAEETPSPAPTDAAAEETPSPAPTEAAAEETPSPAPTEAAAEETPSPAPTEAAAEETPSPAPTDAAAEETPSPAPTEAATEETSSPEATEQPIFTDRDASFSPDFTMGYAEVLDSDAEAVQPDDTVFLLPRGAVVYVSAREDGHLLNVWLDTPDGILSGLMKDNCLRPMSGEESAAFTEEACRRENVRFMDGGDALPLALIESVRFPGAAETPSPAVSIRLDAAEASVFAGGTLTLVPAFSDGENHAYTAASSDESILLPGADGSFSALAAGEATLTFSSEYGEVSCAVRVLAVPGRLNIAEESVVLRVDQTRRLTLETDGDFEGEIVWTSSDEGVAVCDAGEIICTGAGECTVTASFGGVLSDACTVTVKGMPEQITLPYESLTLGVGESIQLEPDVGGALTELTYASSKTKYVKVSDDGVVRAVKKGSATVGVRTDNGLTAYVAVKVLGAPKKVTASPEALLLGVGESGRIGFTLPKNTAGRVKFASSDPDIASIDPDTGLVTAVSEGKVRILVQTFNGKKDYAAVEVRPAPSAVTAAPESDEIGVGQILNVSLAVNDGAAGSVTLSSSDESRLLVSGSMIKGVSEGSAEIIATAYNGVVGRATVTVRPAPEKVTLPYQSLVIGAGEIVRLTPDCGDAVGGFTYASSKAKYVKVSPDGRIYGAKRGTAKVRVRTYNGKEAYVTVKVLAAPKSVSVSPANLLLGVGETGRISYTLPKNTAGSVSFASSSPEIASIDPVTGLVTAVSEGRAKILVQTFNGKKAYAEVEVRPAPEAVTVIPEAESIGVGQILNVSAFVNDGAAGGITLSSSDESRLLVSGSMIKGVREGSAELIASCYNGATGRVTINVLPAPKAVTLPYEALKIGVGEVVQLEPDAGEGAGGFTFASSKTKYVKVSSGGAILGVRKGTAKVGVRTYNGKTAYVTVEVCAAPTAVAISASNLELGAGQSFRIEYRLPSKTAGSVRFSSADPAIAAVDEKTGMVTAAAPGETTVTVSTYNGKTARCTVRVLPAPDQISTGIDSLLLGEGQTYQLNPVLPEGCKTELTYSSGDSRVAAVSPDGLITARGMGTTSVRVQTHVPGVFALLPVEVKRAPSGVAVKETEMKVLINTTFRLEPILPEGSFSPFEFSSSNPGAASISADGTVQTLSVGQTVLTVRTYNGHTASVNLKVWDPLHPEKLVILNAPDVLDLDVGRYALEYSVEPESAAADLQWSSSNPDVATVDAHGVITLHGYGYSVISAVSAKNSAVSAAFTLGVQLENLTLAIPARTTQEDGIEANLAMIDDIRRSAQAQVKALYKGGVISSADAEKRSSIINNIFKDYAFPWKTPELQPYWKAANSEGGVKDFKPDRVYYGMPYMSGGSSNRRYNSAKAIAEQRYVDTGKGYYMLNRKKLLKGTYVGNDCSALVDAAIWGTNSSHSGDRTGVIATSSAYRTINDPKAMRPGDLLCKANSHVVMFLYYANPEKTKIMIIENGGSEPGTNTVHCDVHSLSYYTESGYKVRRLSTLG